MIIWLNIIKNYDLSARIFHYVALDEYILNRYLIETIRKIQFNEEEFHGVVFVSAKDSPGINFAIYDNAINMLEPAIVNLVRITNIDEYGCVSYELLENSSPKDGTLVWS